MTRCRFTPCGRLVRQPRPLIWILQRRPRTFSNSKTQTIRRTNEIFFLLSFSWRSLLAAETTLEKSDLPAIQLADILPVSLGRPVAENDHTTGVVLLVEFNVVPIEYVSFEIVFSLNIAVELPVVLFQI
jgi:hypothetical protein